MTLVKLNCSYWSKKSWELRFVVSELIVGTSEQDNRFENQSIMKISYFLESGVLF